MKKKNAIITISVLSALLIATISFAVSQIVKEDEPKPNYYANKITSPYIPEKLAFAGEEVPMDVYWVHEGLDRELIINCYQHSSKLPMSATDLAKLEVGTLFHVNEDSALFRVTALDTTNNKATVTLVGANGSNTT